MDESDNCLLNRDWPSVGASSTGNQTVRFKLPSDWEEVA